MVSDMENIMGLCDHRTASTVLQPSSCDLPTPGTTNLRICNFCPANPPKPKVLQVEKWITRSAGFQKVDSQPSYIGRIGACNTIGARISSAIQLLMSSCLP